GGDRGKADDDPPNRAEEADKGCGRGERGEKRQTRFEVPQLGVEGKAHRPLDAVAALDRGLGQVRLRQAALGPPAAMPSAVGSPVAARPAAASSACGERAASTRASWSRAFRPARPRLHSFSTITAQLHTEAARSSSMTPLTTMSACTNRPTTESGAAVSFTGTPLAIVRQAGRAGTAASPRPNIRRDRPNFGSNIAGPTTPPGL